MAVAKKVQRDIAILCEIVATLLVELDKANRELAKAKGEKPPTPIVSTPWFRALKEGRL